MERRSGRGTYVPGACMQWLCLSLLRVTFLRWAGQLRRTYLERNMNVSVRSGINLFLILYTVKLKDGTYSCYFSLFRSGPPCWCSVSGQPAFNTLSLHSLLTIFLYLSLTVDSAVVCSLMSGYMHVRHHSLFTCILIDGMWCTLFVLLHVFRGWWSDWSIWAGQLV